MSSQRPDPRVPALLLLALCLAAPASAHHDEDPGDEVPPSWETTTDGGMLSDDVARFAVASRSDNNSVESLFVTAVRVKSDALQALGIDDFDVVTSAFDVETGALRWTTAYDAGLGIFDQPAGIELNYNNNLLHVVADSDGDASIVTYAVSDGSELVVTTLPGATVHGTAISVSGSEMAVVGQRGGDFFFADYESGPQAITIDSTPVAGAAFAVAIHDKTWTTPSGGSDWAPGNTDSWRTFVATGRAGGFAGADVYTAAWRMDQVGHAPVWVRTWDGPDGDWDEGLAAETGYVRATGQTLAWTAGRTRNASGDWDIAVQAHDLNTGVPAWSGQVRLWGGEGATEDAPVAMWYAGATEILYVTGTTDRGAPHGQDIVTLAYRGTTGELLGEALSSGDVSNGDDDPIAVTATHDGNRVFVAAEILDLLPEGGTKHRAALFAFDRGLVAPAGFAWLDEGGFGVDQVGGVATDVGQGAVLLGGSTDPESGDRQDLAGASFPIVEFVPEPGATGSLTACAALLAALARRRPGRG